MRARTSTYVVMFLNGHVYFRNLSLCTRYLKLAKMIERLQNVSLIIYSSLDYTTFNAIGNQIKAGGVHYNVAWTEGVSACDNNVSIAPESSPVCGRNFQVDGNTYRLEGCTATGTGYAQAPVRLLREDGSVFGPCSKAEKKLGCSGSTHDVVKRYLCG